MRCDNKHIVDGTCNDNGSKHDTQQDIVINGETQTTSEPEGAFLFGWFSFTPKCLQVFNTAGWYLFFIFMANNIQGITTNGLVGVVMTSLETRFGLASVQSSWIPAVADVSAVPAILAVSIFNLVNNNSTLDYIYRYYVYY